MPTTKELRTAQREDAVIRTNQGTEVGYSPRYKGDRLPWRMKGWPDEPRYRRNAADCHAESREGGPWVAGPAAPLLGPETGTQRF